jgi:hypothetical protein
MATPKKPPVKSPFLVNGVEMNRQHPNTFNIPTTYAKASLQVGAFVKVSAKVLVNHNGIRSEFERFWVEITKLNYPIFEGRIDNDLLTKELHYNDLIKFHSDNILDIS